MEVAEDGSISHETTWARRGVRIRGSGFAPEAVTPQILEVDFRRVNFAETAEDRSHLDFDQGWTVTVTPSVITVDTWNPAAARLPELSAYVRHLLAAFPRADVTSLDRQFTLVILDTAEHSAADVLSTLVTPGTLGAMFASRDVHLSGISLHEPNAGEYGRTHALSYGTREVDDDRTESGLIVATFEPNSIRSRDEALRLVQVRALRALGDDCLRMADEVWRWHSATL